MEDKDKSRFFNCLIGAAEIAARDLSKTAMKLYWETLKHLEIDVVVDAFSRHLANPDTGQFMPKPADIIKLASGSHLDSALLAWSKVDKAIRSVGSYESVVFDDRIIMAVVSDMGGWISICQSSEDEIKFKANEFSNRYKTYKNMREFSHPKKLIGISENHNSSEGQKIKPPILIGDKDQAMLVYQGGNDCEQVKKISMGDYASAALEKIGHE